MNSNNNWNTMLPEEKLTVFPWNDDLRKVLKKEYPVWFREDKQRWTNCTWETLNYIKNWRNIRLFMKKSFLKWYDIKKLEEDYKDIKAKFKNIIPNQSFIQSSDNWEIFAFCSPICIKVDIFEEGNREYIIELLKTNKNLLRQFNFFVRKNEELISEWKNLDIYWTENLVISDDNKLYYLDSFLVFHKSMIIKNESTSNHNYLKSIIKEATI